MAISITCNRLQSLKIFGLVIGCLAKFVTGSLFVFNVYQDAIKETFNYTQTEVEVMSSMLNLGLGVGFVPGMFYDRFGPQMASGLGLVVSVSAYMLIWSTTRFVPFYRNNSWLMAIYFFICGFGSVFTYMVALNTNIINFDKKWTGTIVGTLNAFFAGSPSVFATLYYKVFSQGTDVENQDYAGFMLMFAISFGIADILCILFLRVYDESDPEYVQFENENGNAQESRNHSSDIDSTDSENIRRMSNSMPNGGNIQNGDSGGHHGNETDSTYAEWEHSSLKSNADSEREYFTKNAIPLKALLLNKDYQLFIWMFAFAACIGLVYGNNITVISKSMHLDAHDKTLTIIIPIVNAITSLLIGLLSDALVKYIPRFVILITGCICFVLCQLLALLFASNLAMLNLATVFAGLAIGILWSVSPAVMKEMFYIGNLGRNWGIAIFIASLVGFGAQALFGALYDVQTPDSQVYCYGAQCIRGGLSLFLGVASLSVILGFIIQLKKLWKRRCCKPM